MKTFVLVGVLFLGVGGALAATLVRLSSLSESAEELAGEVRRLKTRVAEMEAAPKVDLSARLEALERRVDKVPSTVVAAAAVPGAARPTGAAGATPAARKSLSASATSGTGADGAEVGTPDKIKELIQSSLKKISQERRNKWVERRDERMKRDLENFGKTNSLAPSQMEQASTIIQDDRDQRREIRRQVRDDEIAPPAAKQQLDQLKANTEARLKDALGDKGFQAYQQWRQDQRTVMRNTRRF